MKKALNVNIDVELWDHLHRYCKETGINKYAIIEQGIKLFFQQKEKERMILEKYQEDSRK